MTARNAHADADAEVAAPAHAFANPALGAHSRVAVKEKRYPDPSPGRSLYGIPSQTNPDRQGPGLAVVSDSLAPH